MLKRAVVLVCLLATVAGCGIIYKVSIYQGNILDNDDVAELKPGMSKRQVSLILGTPAVANPFRSDRWDYVGSERVNDRTRLKKTLTLVFDENQLSEVLGDYSVPEFGLTASDDSSDQGPQPDQVEG